MAGPTIAELRPGQRFRGDYACVRKDRLTARNGSPYLSLELRDRSGTILARAFREVDRLAARFERGDAVRVAGKVERFRGELVAELDDVRRLEGEELDPADFLPWAYRDGDELAGFLEHLIREVHDTGLRCRRRDRPALRADRHRVPARSLHPRRAPRLPRRPDRAHGRGRDPGRRGLPAPPAARLGPADGRRAAARRRQGPGVRLRRRVRDDRGGQAARPPHDRRRDRRAGRLRAPARAPRRAAALRPHPPRRRRRARDRVPAAASGRGSARRRRWRSTA